MFVIFGYIYRKTDYKNIFGKWNIKIFAIKKKLISMYKKGIVSNKICIHLLTRK